jgi:hypothetical protein
MPLFLTIRQSRCGDVCSRPRRLEIKSSRDAIDIDAFADEV